MLLHFAARREHVTRAIRPALAAGAVVVCDRFADSSLAYQVAGQGGARAMWQGLVELTLDGVWPDRTFLLDLPPEAGWRARPCAAIPTAMRPSAWTSIAASARRFCTRRRQSLRVFR